MDRIITIHLKLDKFILFRLRRGASRICVVYASCHAALSYSLKKDAVSLTVFFSLWLPLQHADLTQF
jgi:hypothetical protein